MSDPFQPPQAEVRDVSKPPFSVPKFLLGLALPMLMLGLTYAAFIVVLIMLYEQSSSAVSDIVAVIAVGTPPLLLLVLEIYFIVKKQRELALGVAFGFSVIVLLVAACFGLIALG